MTAEELAEIKVRHESRLAVNPPRIQDQLALGALATAQAERRPSAFTHEQLSAMSARVKAATDAMAGDTKIDPIDALKVYGASTPAHPTEGEKL